MPYYKPSARSTHQKLVTRLARELGRPPQKTRPQVRPSQPAPDPVIIQEEQKLTNRYHVWVIWDAWAKVPDTERGPVILDAYEQALGREEAIRISVAMGLTPEEAGALGIV